MINHLRNGDSSGYSRAWKVMGLERDITALFSPFLLGYGHEMEVVVVGGCSACSICFGGYEFGESWNIVWLFFPLCENATEA